MSRLSDLADRIGEPVDDWDAYRRRKDALVGALTGTVLELGAGRGANFGRLPRGTTWIGLEPHPKLRAALAANASRAGREPRVLDAPAEHIPLPDGSVDAVLTTVVLCSVSDQAAVLAEIIRVLRPGGGFAFFEHVAEPPGTWPARLQEFWAPIGRRYDNGCDTTRRTGDAIRAAGFAHVDLTWHARSGRLNPYGLYIAGVARTAS